MGRQPKCGPFLEFQFPRKQADGSIVFKAGKIRRDAIIAVTPGSDDAVMHVHLCSGAEALVVQAPIEGSLE